MVIWDEREFVLHHAVDYTPPASMSCSSIKFFCYIFDSSARTKLSDLMRFIHLKVAI